MNNPFLISTYEAPAYFCDREKETAAMEEALLNGRNLTLLSKRRMGKTGLIHHVQNGLARKQIRGFLVDIYATQNTSDLINLLGSALLGQADTWPQRIAKKINELIQSLRPRITYDSLSGQPAVEFYLQQESPEPTLAQILHYLDSQGETMVIAIDEFQQITRYPEKNLEALLRTNVQQMKNLRFIFSGSETGMLMSMFTEAGRPFFQSSQLLHLGSINATKYGAFITSWMKKGGKKIEADALARIFELTRIHTYYVQVLCNRLYAKEATVIDVEAVNRVMSEILKENEYVYYNYRHILTAPQWQFLRAVAKEGKVYSPNASAFLSKYGLGAASSANRSLVALEERDMIFRDTSSNTAYYHVQDVFLEKWLQMH